jgi:hypothetical protein
VLQRRARAGSVAGNGLDEFQNADFRLQID